MIRQRIRGYSFSTELRDGLWRFQVRPHRSSVLSVAVLGLVAFAALASWFIAIPAMAEAALLGLALLLAALFTIFASVAYTRGVRVQIDRERGDLRIKGPLRRLAMPAADIDAVMVSVPSTARGSARVLLKCADGAVRKTWLDFRLSRHADMFEEVALPAGRCLADALGKPLFVRRELSQRTDDAIPGWRKKVWLGGVPAELADANRPRVVEAGEYLGCTVAETERGFSLVTPRDAAASSRLMVRYAIFAFLCFIPGCMLGIFSVVILAAVLLSFFRAMSTAQPTVLAVDTGEGNVYLDRQSRKALSPRIDSVAAVCLDVIDAGEVFFGTLGVRFEDVTRFHIPLSAGPLGSRGEVLVAFRPLAHELAAALGTTVAETGS